MLFLPFIHGFVFRSRRIKTKHGAEYGRIDREWETLNCSKCELFRVRGVRDKEKQLIVSHEVSLAPVKSEPTARTQWRIPEDGALCFHTGWSKNSDNSGACFTTQRSVFLEFVSKTLFVCNLSPSDRGGKELCIFTYCTVVQFWGSSKVQIKLKMTF